MFIMRHGDVLIKQVSALPKGVKKIKTNVLAEGEITGHRHTVVVDRPDTMTMYEAANGKFLELCAPAVVTHQEHKTLTIPAGIFEVTIEREFDPFNEVIKRVVD